MLSSAKQINDFFACLTPCPLSLAKRGGLHPVTRPFTLRRTARPLPSRGGVCSQRYPTKSNHARHFRCGAMSCFTNRRTGRPIVCLAEPIGLGSCCAQPVRQALKSERSVVSPARRIRRLAHGKGCGENPAVVSPHLKTRDPFPRLQSKKNNHTNRLGSCTQKWSRADLCLNDKSKPVDWRVREAATSRPSYTSVSSFCCRNMVSKIIKIFAERQRRSKYMKYHLLPISHASKTQIGKKASDKITRLTNGEILNVSSPNK